MTFNFEEIKTQIQSDSSNVSTSQELEAFRIKYLGKKGLVASMYASLATASKEEKPLIGKNTNIIKG